ncbi:MAG: TetR/AcrR family transcriptional regulator [Solirubrobacteraceae bacterium]|nr:TetR/AcrR family transcriptional regulator [Solirubrobacteraceae bacterium]
MSAPVDYEIDEPLIAEVMRLLSGAEWAPLPRHRHGIPREEIELQQRARIITATAQHVVEHGYTNTKPREIATRAGVSTRTFYDLYADKEAAFFAAYSLLDGVMIRIIRTPFDVADPRAALRGGIGAFLRQLAAAPLFTRLRLVEGRFAGQKVLERQYEMYDAMVDRLHADVQVVAESDPSVFVPTRGAMTILVTGISGLVLQHLVEHGHETLPELEPAIIEICERVVFGDAAERPQEP